MMEDKPMLDSIAEKLSSLTPMEFLALGMDGLAYIKPLGERDGIDMYAVHAADGSHIASGPDIHVLQAIASRQNLASMYLQ